VSQHPGGFGRDDSGRLARIDGIDPLLDDNEVAQITGRARSTLQKDRVIGTGIPFVRVGRLVRYRQSDVAAYLAALPSLRSTSEAA
jgi:predicted DNA-binding transcriptional regulator AlpA